MPQARLDNNPAERAIRSLAIGCKNWLFFGSKESGEAAATLLSLVQTCRALIINPRTYLEDICRRIMGRGAHKLYELLPDEWLRAGAALEQPPHLEKMGSFPAYGSPLLLSACGSNRRSPKMQPSKIRIYFIFLIISYLGCDGN